MFKRNLVLSGVLRKQSRLAKLKTDLERRNSGVFVVSGVAREKIERQIDCLKQMLKGDA